MRRSYSAREYYEPNKDRENLSVLTHALVSKIELEKTDSGGARATGVSFIVDGISHTVKANKEVIICGGTINSPQILELSGIGSQSVLSKAGVDVVVENPYVGEGLNDHAAVGITVVSTFCYCHYRFLTHEQKVKDECPTAEVVFRNPEIAQQAMQAYVQHKAGPLTNPPTTCGFVNLEIADPELQDPQNHVESLIAEFNKSHPDFDIAGRDVLLKRQVLDPKEAIAQTILLGVGADVANM